ncbi:PREDICTED: DNA-binding protein RHL1 isoform X2 [Populus euphratica]|uniref:DNA-binding protein RHL1 isoform X2 n=1 Tax=Populus euphratica TaxID=75702 RepID=A0AAJ6XY52_POPEU|nr:PREDICTED: DNA-binding protein RHL1 isoform X2 [Populus euphratica]
MVKSKKTEASNSNRENPDVLERKRLKKLAITSNIVSDAQVKAPYSLNPSKTVAKHHGKDIIRKSQRKNRFLFSFPGLLAPINGGGKIGELKDLSSKNPVLYLDFPQGQMKLFGTILHPKNRYLTLQFSRSGKNVMCEDYFDHMIIFSEAWWIGTKEENPEELKLDFPNELFEGKGVECDFKGGAGAGSVNKQVVQKSDGTKYVKEESSETELDDDLSDINNDFKDLKETTPIRQSARTSGKKFKFTEVSSGDDSAERSPDALGVEEEEEEKKEAPRNSRKSSSSKDSDQKLQKTDLKRKIDLVEAPRKRGTVTEGKKAGTGSKAKKKVNEVEDDDIEEFSSSSQGTEESDEDWEA